MNKFFETGSVCNIDSLERRLAHTKITGFLLLILKLLLNLKFMLYSETQLRRLDRLVHRRRDLSAKQCKQRLGLLASKRTVQHYLRILG